MASYAYYNGHFDIKENVKIPLTDRSIFFGDAVYDAAIGSYDKILWEDEHINRFLDNANKIGIKPPFGYEYLSALLREIAVKSMFESYFLYFQLSRNNHKRIHSANGCSSNLLITIDPIKIEDDPKPMRLITVEDRRHGYCDIKTIDLLPAVLASTKAENCGCDEAIFVRNGIVTECEKSNISIIKQGRLITHPITSEILPGITRRHLLSICAEISIPVSEDYFTPIDLINADEVIITSTTKLCRSAVSIDGFAVGGKDTKLKNAISNRMLDEYKSFCFG